MKVTERVEKLMQKHGYTKAELAKALGVSRQWVYQWFRDGEIPHTRLLAIADLFEVNAANLVFGERIKKINEEKLLEIIVEMDKQVKRLSKKNGKEIKLSPKRRAKIIYEAYEEEELSYIKKAIEVISS